MREMTRRRRGTGLALALVVVAASVLAAPAIPASASVPGLVQVAARSELTNSAAVKTATVTCPNNTVLTGTGYATSGAEGEVVIGELKPDGSPTKAPTSVAVTAYEADPFSGNWTVTAHAICARLVGTAQFSRASSTGPDDFNRVVTDCPTGKVLTGTGFEVTGPPGAVVVDQLAPGGGPTLAPTSVLVGAHKLDEFDDDWSVTGYAICSDPLPGLGRILATSAVDSDDFHRATPTCPGGTNVLTGLGFEVTGTAGQAVVDDMASNGTRTTPPFFANVTAYEEDPPFDDDWMVIGYAICANR
jgi:hypothetical protein